MMGNLEQALADLNRAIEIAPNNADAYYNRGKARTELRDPQGAIADYTEAIRLNPELAGAYGNRGLLYAETGDRAAAVADLRQALQLFGKQGDQASSQQTLLYLQQLQPSIWQR